MHKIGMVMVVVHTRTFIILPSHEKVSFAAGGLIIPLREMAAYLTALRPY
jgi:hypothetical protein